MPNNVLGDTQKVPYFVAVQDADKNPAALLPGDTITVVSSDTASATVVPDAVPAAGFAASGFIVGGSKLQTGVSFIATLTHADGTTLVSTPLLEDIVGGAPAAVALSVGTAVPQ